MAYPSDTYRERAQGEGAVSVTRTFNKEVFHAKKHAPVARAGPFES